VLLQQDNYRCCQLGFASRGHSGSPSCILCRDLCSSTQTGQASMPGSERQQQRHRHGNFPSCVEVTDLSTKKQHTPSQSISRRRPACENAGTGIFACAGVCGRVVGRDTCMYMGACGGERRRDPRLAPWWTWRSVRRRLPANLTEQAGSARISPGGHRRSDLVLKRVVVWTRLGVRARGACQHRNSCDPCAYAFLDEGEGTR
jgi:hypothetical protein